MEHNCTSEAYDEEREEERNGVLRVLVYLPRLSHDIDGRTIHGWHVETPEFQSRDFPSGPRFATYLSVSWAFYGDPASDTGPGKKPWRQAFL